MSQSFTLYRFFDAQDRLLYIGKTVNPSRRWREHEKTKDWFDDVATVKREVFANADLLDAAEIAAIKAEGPLHNVAHNGVVSIHRSRRRNPPTTSGAAVRQAVAEYERRTEVGDRPTTCEDSALDLESRCPCAAHQELRLRELDRMRDRFGSENLPAAQALDDLERTANDPEFGYMAWVEELLDVELMLPLMMRAQSAEDPCPAFASVEANGVLDVGCPFCSNIHQHLFVAGQAVGLPLSPPCGGPASEGRYRPYLELENAWDAMARWCRRHFVLRREYAA